MLSSQQQKIATYFENAVASGSVRHAYIIKGDDGVGKTHLSRKLRHYFACNTNSACGVCPGCKSDSAGAHPDVLCFENADKKGYKIDEIREIIKRIYEKPVSGKYKLIVIENAHLLDQRCQNALLKAIEEPPFYAVFVLLCDNLNIILPTILSRVMVIELSSWKRQELETAFPLSREDSYLYNYCMGNIGRLVSICADEEFKAARLGAISAIQKAFGQGLYSVNEASEEFLAHKEHVREMLGVLTLFMRDIIFMKNGLSAQIVNTDKLVVIKDMSEKLTMEQALRSAELIGAETALIKNNENLNMQIQTMFMKLRNVAE